MLDEPTSAMDAHTERLVLDGLQHLTANRTVFTIAHVSARYETPTSLWSVRGGQVAETGSPDVLLDQTAVVDLRLARPSAAPSPRMSCRGRTPSLPGDGTILK